MTGFNVKGWCPGAYQPMQSGDGLVVRVRPRLARLSRAQALGLCDLALTHASGVIDLTNRANLQVRGVTDAGHQDLLAGLADLDLLDDTPETEGRRNIVTAPLRRPGDLVEDLSQALIDRLPDLPGLPAKFGFAVDSGPAPMLGDVSADIRVERSADGSLIIRADGADRGRIVTANTAIDTVIELARWFAAIRPPQTRRMARLLAEHTLPPDWTETPPQAPAPRLKPGPGPAGLCLGAAFGALPAAALRDLIAGSDATGLIVTPWRLFILDGTDTAPDHPFVTTAHDPLLRIDACPGAPYCTSASVETRQIAAQLAPRLTTNATASLHVSGCAKGCARSRPADVTLVGRDGAFDLVRAGCSWDEPRETGLTPQRLTERSDLL